MPEIEFSIDTTTGELRMHVQGIPGHACDDVANLAKQLLGQPAHEQPTAEYHLQTHVRPQARTQTRR